jgi:hypothetical protein
MAYPVKYTDEMPEWQAGYARGPLIRIRPTYKDDVGMYQHELTHVKQWFLSLGIHPLLYLWRPYRLWSEASAYAVQMKYLDRHGGYLTLENAAYRLALPQYDLHITEAEAANFIKDHS